MNENPLLNKRMFRSRRVMAYISLAGIFILTIGPIFLVPVNAMTVYTDVLLAGIYVFAGIIATYMGTTTYSYNQFIKGMRPNETTNP